jgi:HlyD family secretion protein
MTSIAAVPTEPIAPPETPQSHRWRTIFIATALVTFGASAALLYRHAQASRRPAHSRFETAAVSRGPIEAKVTSTGTVNAIITVQVGSQVSGTVSTLYADFNSVVKKGDLLARIDPSLFLAALEQAKANETAARGNLAKARATLANDVRSAARTHRLLTDRLVSQADVDTADTLVEVDRATVEAMKGALDQAMAAFDQASINLRYTTIVSPISGTVISRSVDVGQTVAASLAAPTLFQIAEDLRQMEVDTNIAEADVGRLQEKMKATFTVDAYPNEVFPGTIRQVRNAPQTIQNVVTYDAVIDVDNSDLKLRPGMTANVTVVYARRSDVVRVSNAALRFRPPADFGKPPAVPDPTHRVVWALQQGKPVPIVVKTDVSDGSVSELIEGALKEGDQLITEAEPLTKSTPSFGRVL